MSGLFSSGCLLPQEENFLEEVAPARNRAPRIIITDPASPLVSTKNGPGCTVTFKVNVADPDIDDSIRVLWLIDGNVPQGRTPQPIPPSGKEIRDISTELRETLSAAGSLLVSPGSHLVEVVIADSELDFRDPKPKDTPTDGGTPQNPGYADETAWFVDVEQGSCPQ